MRYELMELDFTFWKLTTKNKFIKQALFVVMFLMTIGINAQNNKLYEPEMVKVEGGVFMMGNNIGFANERPVHSVTLSSFNLGKCEITQQQLQRVMGKNPSYFNFQTYDTSFPLENVSWLDVQEYLKRLNEMTGKKYRLPTEAEWEYAARGGNKSKGFIYSGSNNIWEVGIYDGTSGGMTCNTSKDRWWTCKPNELGIWDMTGNVSELFSDKFGEYRSDSVINTVVDTGIGRVIRGGAWNSGP